MIGVRQLSGAVISRFDNLKVTKTGLEPRIVQRLIDQGKFMQELNYEPQHESIVPIVHSMLPNGYVMERCNDVDLWERDVPMWFNQMKMRLMSRVWSQFPRTRSHPDWHTNLKRHFHATCYPIISDAFMSDVNALIDRVALVHQSDCTIHGDCTLDNLLWSSPRPHKHGTAIQLLISDPLPTDDRIPQHRAVDLGKMLQSAVGWENLRYLGKPSIQVKSCVDAVLDGEDKETRDIAWVWCLIHLLRILPYAEQKSWRNGLVCMIHRVMMSVKVW